MILNNSSWLKNEIEMIGSEREGVTVERIGGVSGRNIEGDLSNNRAVIGEKIDLEKGDSAVSFIVDDLPGARSGTTIFRERRGMNIDDFVGKNVDHFLIEERRTKSDTKTNVQTPPSRLRRGNLPLTGEAEIFYIRFYFWSEVFNLKKF